MIKYVDIPENNVSFSRSLVFNGFEKTADLKTEEKLDKRILEHAGKVKSDAKKVYVLMTAMSASDYWGANNNHDYFFERDLWNDEDSNTGYLSFLTANPFRNHKNDDPSKGLGQVEISTYNPKMHRVELVVRIDRDKTDKHGHSDLFERLMSGERTGVSMGIKIPNDYCSFCGNPAKTKKDYCEHIRSTLGQIMPNGVKVVMLNPKGRLFDISFIDGRQADNIARVISKVDDIPVLHLTRPNKSVSEKKDEVEKTAAFSEIEKIAEEHGEFYHGSPHKITSLRAGSWVTPYLEDARVFGVPWSSADLSQQHNNDPSGRPPKELHFNDEVLNGDYTIPDRPLYVYKIRGSVAPAHTNTGKSYEWNKKTLEELPVELVEEHGSWRKAIKTNLKDEMSKVAERRVDKTYDYNGIKIKIEYPVGSTRKGKGWSTKMKASYGRIPKTKGADGECCDVYLAPHPRGDNIYVIRQVDDKGNFDEHKYMMGFITKEEAKRVFLEHIPEKYYSAIAEIKIEKFKELIGGAQKEADMIKEVPATVAASGYKLNKVKK
jgi:hypothetical protein